MVTGEEPYDECVSFKEVYDKVLFLCVFIRLSLIFSERIYVYRITRKHSFVICSDKDNICVFLSLPQVQSGTPPAAIEMVESADMRAFILRCLLKVEERPTALELLQDKFLFEVSAINPLAYEYVLDCCIFFLSYEINRYSRYLSLLSHTHTLFLSLSQVPPLKVFAAHAILGSDALMTAAEARLSTDDMNFINVYVYI